MPSIRELAKITKFSRESITARVKLFKLGDDPDPRQIFEFRPLDGNQTALRSLAEERAELAKH